MVINLNPVALLNKIFRKLFVVFTTSLRDFLSAFLHVLIFFCGFSVNNFDCVWPIRPTHEWEFVVCGFNEIFWFIPDRFYMDFNETFANWRL